MPVAVVWVAAAVLLLLLSEARGWRGGIWMFKPAASAGFLFAAFACVVPSSEYGRLILGALLLSFVGDVLLIPKRSVTFKAGLAAFLLAHLAFASAFLVRGEKWGVVAAALPIVCGGGYMLYRWLAPHLPPSLRLPVAAYVASLGAMVALATGSALPAAVLGSILFTASDAFVARNRFVSPAFVNKAWGTPLYYAAQMLLAWSVCG